MTNTEHNVPTDIAASLEELGIEIVREDDDEIYAKCPGHLARLGKEDGHASWSVNAESGMHNCFSCGFKGNFTALVHEILSCTWPEANDWAKSHTGGIARVRQILDRPKKVSSSRVDTTTNINEASLALFTDPPPEALSGRLLTLEACHAYGVMWNPAKESWILPTRQPNTYKLMGWQEKSKRIFNNYPPHTPFSTTLFGIDHFAWDADHLILVESPLDAVRLESADHHCAVASFGANVSDAQTELLVSWGTILLVAMDNDAAGWKSARELKRKLAGRMTVRFLNYEGIDVKDVGEMSNNEIHHAVYYATSSVLTRF